MARSKHGGSTEYRSDLSSMNIKIMNVKDSATSIFAARLSELHGNEIFDFIQDCCLKYGDGPVLLMTSRFRFLIADDVYLTFPVHIIFEIHQPYQELEQHELDIDD
jgi:hypothetical protein